MPIRILPEETINKIAAGEVIERPANVVKELLENSLDAGSTSIEIEITGAGRRLIRVRDNGSGIPGEELKLSVTRHATSKITGFNDLESLDSLGFRGEALPSIAAVSKLLIQSQPPGSPAGSEISISGGRVKKEASWVGAPGTNIEVSELFFNTPARDKFLKSDQTERGRILRTAEELALSAPDVSFKIVSEGKTVLETPRTSELLERITDVLGKEFASTLTRAELNHPFIKLTAFITKREQSLASKNFQFLFVNKRPVNLTRNILHAVYEAYRENLPAGRHPGLVMFIETNPAEIDVNIHPTKREVRFSKEQQIHHVIYSFLKDALGKAPATELGLSRDSSGGGVEQRPVSGSRETNARVSEPRARYSYTEALSKSGLFAPPEGAKPASQPEFERGGGEELPLKIIGQAFNLYVIAQDAEGILVIDQHAAAERVRYERYMRQWQEKKIAIQPLLFPENIELPASLRGAAAPNLELIRETGLEVEEFGADTLRITAAPAVLGGNVNAKNMLVELLEALTEETSLPRAEKIEKIIRTACRTSIKAGDTISSAEASRLAADLIACKSPNTCPHGRPTMLRIKRSELEKHFGRK